MGRDGSQAGVRVRKFLLISTRIVYRSVRNHPFVVGIFLFLLFLYRSYPFLFSLLVSASPVLVCTAVLLGTLLSLGEPNGHLIEEVDISNEIVQLKTGRFEDTKVVEKDEGFSTDWYPELRREVVERSVDEVPLVDSIDRVSKIETNDDVDYRSVLADQNSREIRVEKQLIDEASIEFENLEIEQKVNLDDQQTLVGVEAGLSHVEVLENRSSGKIQSENSEDYKSAEGSDDTQISDRLEFSTGSWKQFDEVLEGRYSPVQKIQAAVHAQIRNQLESSLRSWKQLDDVVGDKPSPSLVFQTDNFNDDKPAEGLVDTEIRDRLESSLGSWKQLDSDHAGDDESDSGSDGAESSSPDASLADIIPMLDELHPLLEDENPQTSNLSRESSAAMMARPGKSHESSIHSNDESDQKEEEAGDFKSDADDDEEEETQGSKEDRAKSAITWTEDDQKNLMDLGSSELERNQRLESLIARRRARKNFGLMTERNLIDLDGMDLQFQVTPISTTRRNPFDLPHESYDDLGLPPVPGSAPSVLASRRNPFDLPYDSSEEKPDLMGDSFQQEFMELNQRETTYQKEAVFRRNETFSLGSSFFDFTRQDGRDGKRTSRFKPYFTPERTDSDLMSYSSFQRQSSELSESKLSSAGEAESTSAYEDEEGKKSFEHESTQEMGPSSEIDHASLYVEHGSQSSEDVHSLSDQESEHEEGALLEPVTELGGAENSFATASHASEVGLSDEISLDVEKSYSIAQSYLPEREFSTSNIHVKKESIEEDATSNSSSSPSPKEHNDLKVEDVDEDLVSGEQSQVNNVENAVVSVEISLQAPVSDIPDAFSRVTDLEGSHQKEPVFDSSPRVVQENHSSSSIRSEMCMKILDIDSDYISTVRRDVFVNEESEDHEGATEQCTLNGNQDTDDNCLTVKQSVEGNIHGNNEFHFSVVNQCPLNLEASLMPEYETHLNVYSSDTELVKDELLDDKVSSHKGQVLSAEYNAGVTIETKLDGVLDKDDKSYATEFQPSRHIVLPSEKSEISTIADSVSSVQRKLSHVGVELREESILQEKADHQFLASSPDLKHNDNAVERLLVSPFDEALYFPNDSVIHGTSDEFEKQEPAIISREPEEAVEVEEVDETVNMVLTQESQENVLLGLLPSDDPSSLLQDFEEKPFFNMVNKEPMDINISQDHGVPGYVEKISFDMISDIKEMDEDLLSELDAVGDFSVKEKKGPNMNMSQIFSNAEVDSNIVEQELGEVYSGMSLAHETLLEGNTFVEKFEGIREMTESNDPRFEEPNLHSHRSDVDTGLLVLEAQSVEDIDTAFKKVSEGEAQGSAIAEPLQAELTREQMENPYQETELIQEDTEHGIHATEDASLKDDITVVNNELHAKSIASDVDSVKLQHLDTHRREDKSEISILDEEISEQVVDDFEIVETETEMFNVVESLSTAAETLVDSGEPVAFELSCSDESVAPTFEFGVQVERVGSEESEPLRIGKEIEKSPIVQASTDSAVESEQQSEEIDFLESKTLDIHREVKEIQESPVAEASLSVESEHPTGRVGFVESESMLVDSHTKEILKLPVVEANIAPSVDSDYHAERVGSLESESLLIDGDVKAVQESPVEIIAPFVVFEDQIERVGSVDSQPIDRSIERTHKLPIVEASFALPTEEVCLVESGSSIIDGNIEERQESPVVDASVVPTVESEDQAERVGSVESELLQTKAESNEMQESPVFKASIASAVDFKDQIEVSPQVEVGEVQAVQDLQLPSEQESHDLTKVDSATITIDSADDKSGSQECSERAFGKSSSEVEEGKSNSSPLEYSLSSPSSGSS